MGRDPISICSALIASDCHGAWGDASQRKRQKRQRSWPRWQLGASECGGAHIRGRGAQKLPGAWAHEAGSEKSVLQSLRSAAGTGSRILRSSRIWQDKRGSDASGVLADWLSAQ